jgi:hypothetical protein
MAYQLYAIDRYQGKGKHFIETASKKLTLNGLIKELKNDKGYHMRLHRETQYTFFGDYDGYDTHANIFDEFAHILVRFLSQSYDINILVGDISYTENESKKGSFHYSVPSIYCGCGKLQEIHANLVAHRPELKGIVDTSIYTEKWFRYPDQSKEMVANTKHVIKKGTMKDFVVEYLPKNSECVDNKVYIKTTMGVRSTIPVVKQNTIPKTPRTHESMRAQDDVIDDETADETDGDITDETDDETAGETDDSTDADGSDSNKSDDPDSLINAMEPTRVTIQDNIGKLVELEVPHKEKMLEDILSRIKLYNNYDDWIHVGMALKNESVDNEFFDLWDRWSQRAEKLYDGTEKLKKKWKTFGKSNTGYGISYLLTLLREYDVDEHAKKKLEIDICNIMMRNKIKHYPDNECVVQKLYSTDNSHFIVLVDKHCPFYNGVHQDAESHLIFVVDGVEYMGYMMCTDKECTGKKCPIGGFNIHRTTIKNVFPNITNINNGIINNIYAGNQKYNQPIDLGNDPQIYDDPVFNMLMIRSLEGSKYSIAKAICHYYKGTLCVVDEKIYQYIGVCWTRLANEKKLLSDFSPLYSVADAYVEKMEQTGAMSKVKRIDALRIIESTRENLTSKSKQKKIIELIKIEFGQKVVFDSRANLLVFKDMVYDVDMEAFRQGVPGDLISKTLDMNYPMIYVNQPDTTKKLKSMLSESYGRFMRFIATCLKTCGQHMMVRTKKSTEASLIKLIKSTLGFYCAVQSEQPIDCNKPTTARLMIIESGMKMSPSDTKQISATTNVLHFCKKSGKHVIELSDKTVSNKYAIPDSDFMLLLIKHMQRIRKGRGDEKISPPRSVANVKTICTRFIKECIRASKNNASCADIYERFLLWADTNNAEKISRQKLFKEMKLAIAYRRTAYVGDKKTTGFINVELV